MHTQCGNSTCKPIFVRKDVLEHSEGALLYLHTLSQHPLENWNHAFHKKRHNFKHLGVSDIVAGIDFHTNYGLVVLAFCSILSDIFSDILLAFSQTLSLKYSHSLWRALWQKIRRFPWHSEIVSGTCSGPRAQADPKLSTRGRVCAYPSWPGGCHRGRVSVRAQVGVEPAWSWSEIVLDQNE